MKARSLFYLVLFVSNISYAARGEYLHSKAVQYDFSVNAQDCERLDSLMRDKLELSMQMENNAAMATSIMKNAPILAEEFIESAGNTIKQLSEDQAKLIEKYKELDVNISNEYIKVGGTRRMEFSPSIFVLHQSQVKYTNITSIPSVSAQDLPPFLSDKIVVHNNAVSITSVLSKGYACLLQANGIAGHAQPSYQIYISPVGH